MSDPVSNIQIEDVLSSIRRLVSEDTRIERGPVPSAEGRKTTKLMLTPSQRVPDEAQPEQAWQAEGQPFDAPFDEILSDDIQSTETAEADVLGSADAFVASGNTTEMTDAPWRNPDATLFNAVNVRDLDAASDEQNEEDDANLADVYTLEDMIASRDIAESLESSEAEDQDNDQADDIHVAFDEGIQTSSEFLAVDELNSDIIEHDDIVEYDDEEDNQHSDEDFADGLNGQETAWVGEADDFSHSERVAALSDKIKALEAAIGRSHDQWDAEEIDAVEVEPSVNPAVQWNNQGPQDAAAPSADAPSAIPSPDADKVDVIAPDEAVLDEEMLRELVSDIVREELQGALGERITRNVRKLVRREIHRALTTQEFD